MTTRDDGKLHGGEGSNGGNCGGEIDNRGGEPKTVAIEVNGHKVEMPEGPATGLEIKAAAIKQDVAIQPNFVLQLELPNGTSKVIGYGDKVLLREYLSFTAIAPDDNS